MPNSKTLKSVVITGASSGIGRACALHMDRLGWQVFAGVRKESDEISLRAEGSDRLIPLMLDVTDARSIQDAREVVRSMQGGAGLSGLVNNAGLPSGGPVEFLALDDVRRRFDVNFFGVIAVTQAFLPLLRLAQGRIVNMSSVSGMVAAPFVSPYSTSKFALEALTDALRVELHPWHIDVCSIQPGAIDTPIWEKSGDFLRRLIDSYPPEARDLYGGAISGMQPRFVPHGIPADSVAKAVAHALTSPHPKTRYRVGLDSVFVSIFRLLPDRLRDRIVLSQLPKWGLM